MLMHVSGKLSLILLTLTFSFVFPPTSNSLFCPLVAWSRHPERDFGQDGRDGTNGRAGRRGRDGENRTIFVDGSPINLELSGGDGGDGNNGQPGEDGNCARQPRKVDYDLQAADGGDGGNGGNGGDGGDGGSLTVYYTNREDLKQIYVRSLGGRRGRSGRGAYGGDGCDCDDRSWEIETCEKSDNGDEDCETERFECEEGEEGDDGRDGQDGKDGSMGTLTLINRTEALPPDKPTATVTLPQLQNGAIALSVNQWQTRSSATALLAPNSIIANQYREFVGRLERSFELVWNADRAITDFYNQPISLSLKSDQRIDVSLPKEVWFDGTMSQQGDVTKFVVTNALLEREATQLTRADFAGNRSELTFSVVDLAGKSDLLDTQFWLKYRTANSGDRFRRFYNYRTRYEGIIPAELVTRHNNRYTLEIGKLPIQAEYLRPGVAIEIELVATRSFAGNSAQQEMNWRGEIR